MQVSRHAMLLFPAMVFPTRVDSRLTCFCLLIGLLASPASAQSTINVPANAPTIQAGINAASNGDTVLVSPGTYFENIDFMGKTITVTSSGGPAVTTIDGGQKGIVVNFANNETRASVINGFTITDDGPPLPTQVPFNADGIFVGGANPTITNDIITNNRGFGILVYFGSAYISGNTISNTSTAGDPAGDFGCDYDDGDGIFIQGTSNAPLEPPVIDHNTIEQNVGHCLVAASVSTLRLFQRSSPITPLPITRAWAMAAEFTKPTVERRRQTDHTVNHSDGRHDERTNSRGEREVAESN